MGKLELNELAIRSLRKKFKVVDGHRLIQEKSPEWSFNGHIDREIYFLVELNDNYEVIARYEIYNERSAYRPPGCVDTYFKKVA